MLTKDKNSNYNRWYNRRSTREFLDISEQAQKYSHQDKAYFFGDEITFQFTKSNIDYEIARMEARASRESEQSCLYFRQSLSGFCVWMMLMNSKIYEGEIEKATTIKSIIDHTRMAKATAANHLKIACQNGWAIKFEATETVKCQHWEASELCMFEYLQRLKRESEHLPVKRYTSHAAFHALQDHLKQFE